jgi:hypothetical protein
MMASEINTSQCRVAAAALTDAGFVELRLLTVVWALDRQDDDPSGIAEFGGE